MEINKNDFANFSEAHEKAKLQHQKEMRKEVKKGLKDHQKYFQRCFEAFRAARNLLRSQMLVYAERYDREREFGFPDKVLAQSFYDEIIRLFKLYHESSLNFFKPLKKAKKSLLRYKEKYKKYLE